MTIRELIQILLLGKDSFGDRFTLDDKVKVFDGEHECGLDIVGTFKHDDDGYVYIATKLEEINVDNLEN